ncbi:unnamed protein product [Ilex paraguariensis]|uniref:DUF8204 domain-containing protein n=1 Tax=Ilex paraguariensis TaxID=185542 RepID=A0ABC8SPE3_9AQUA
MEEETVAGKEIVGGGDDISPNTNDNRNKVQPGGSGSSSKQGKSCKGCLYYSSTIKSKSRNPLCVGITRSLPQVPRYIVGESEMEASKEGRNLTEFRYACVGYSVYPDRKNQSTDVQESQAELPVCVGIETEECSKLFLLLPCSGHYFLLLERHIFVRELRLTCGYLILMF